MKTRWWVIAAVVASVSVAAADKTPTKTAKKAAGAKKAQAEAPVEAPPPEAAAEEPPADPLEGIEHVMGPSTQDLGQKAVVQVPAGFAFIPQAEARRLAAQLGDDTDYLLALIVKPGSNWTVYIQGSEDGWVNDSDAGELDASELLGVLRKATEQQNAVRRSKGISDLVVDDWSEKPNYDHARHHLIWGLNVHSQEKDGPQKAINYQTRILGRYGFLSFTVIDAPENIAAARAEAEPVLQGTHYVAGATYADHVSSDKDSGMGLKTLIVGGLVVAGAKKGFFVFFILIMKKAWIAIVAAFAWFRRKMFGKKSAEVMPDSNVASFTPPAKDSGTDDGPYVTNDKTEP